MLDVIVLAVSACLFAAIYLLLSWCDRQNTLEE